ncbi:MAG: DUF3237 domain-containing protein [Stellaceae bacterium]
MTEPLDPSLQPKKLPQMLPQFEYVMQTRIITGKGTVMGEYAGTGTRMMVPVLGGDFEGPGLKGKVLPGGTEWPLVRHDGKGTIDARYTFQTDDGVYINIRNTGMRYGPPDIMRRLNAGDGWIDPDEYYFRTWTVFEAPAGKYAWLCDFVFIGIAERVPECLYVRYYKIV